MNVVSAVLVVVFAVIGLAAVVREISLLLFCYKDDSTVMLITPIQKNAKDAEFALRSALTKQRWHLGKNCSSTVCLDSELDEKTRKICESICRDCGFEHFITKDEFIKMLKSE